MLSGRKTVTFGTGQACHRGSVAEVLTAGICVIGMTVLMASYLGNVQLMDRKAQISQVARKYILRMETVGFLTGNDKQLLLQELAQIGVTEADLTGSTTNQVEFGSPITLMIRGKINGQNVITGNDLLNMMTQETGYDFEEYRMSTAKN